jgi:hypothetical protein
MQDISDKEMNTLIEGLKKIEGFDFGVDSYVTLRLQTSDQT